MMAAGEFDLDRYLRASKRVDLTGMRWDLIPDHPLRKEEARVLAYMMDIESHTVIFLRDLLATRAAFDPDVTAFLSCWVYEELWHGEAFSRFLGESGYRLPPDGERVRADSTYPSRGQRNAWIRRAVGGRGYLAHLATLVGAAAVKDFVAVHMTWGAVNELSTLTAYRLLIERTQHPVLRDLLTRVVKDERRHFAFYRAQARRLLARSKRARSVTRWALERLWAPVGTGVRPQPETDFAVVWVLGDEAGRRAAAEMDATIGELPGLGGMSIVRDALDEAGRRSRPRSGRPRLAAPLAAFRA